MILQAPSFLHTTFIIRLFLLLSFKVLVSMIYPPPQGLARYKLALLPTFVNRILAGPNVGSERYKGYVNIKHQFRNKGFTNSIARYYSQGMIIYIKRCSKYMVFFTYVINSGCYVKKTLAIKKCACLRPRVRSETFIVLVVPSNICNIKKSFHYYYGI